MEREEFKDIISSSLVEMFSGTTIGAFSSSKPSHSLVATDGPCKLFLKPKKAAPYRLTLSRSQPFVLEERQLVIKFMTEFEKVGEEPEDGYLRDMLSAIPRKVISNWLPLPPIAKATLHQAILQFESLSSQTYEGRPIVSAMGITGSLAHGRVKFADLWKEDFSKVVANGFDSMLTCGSDGRFFSIRYLPPGNRTGFFPNRLSAIANWTTRTNRASLVLNRSGEILVFCEGELRFAKRRGAWRYYPHDSMIKRMGVSDIELREAIYQSCLDVSFARTGGCLALLSQNGERSIGRTISADDLFENGDTAKTTLLKSARKKLFHKLDRRMRQELLAIDGATVLDHKGRLLPAGAIISVPSGSSGGGRKAAARALSRRGLGIKISSDGPIIGYRQRSEVFNL